ncbi:enoyl-CoA hydratase/isomerase family protein [Crenobacter caeni]|uniref:3-hydroxyisobutyryl-CoA hydrolase n=1 Tax=Crenobacter caeni TaxID=2705474 RepID=A0A6B2KUG4_9NEIS|nr:enoyl-CoA hydratase/isomerase family protein [Crenobacter caeni]NDV13778.1 enoyl-CoA hydratase/isomerase family protein [Crenobacter caeni]
MSAADCVLFAEYTAANGYRIATATLNSERTLNALTLEMIRALSTQLARWQDDPRVALVVLSGSGERAFCAGGDVRALYRALTETPAPCPHPYAETYFSEEYALDYLIHTYRKPVLVWGRGIVMGGGLGLLAGASHRVVTPSTRMAMPEVSIGLFPDVGGSWFLNRMPGRVGLFLGLTGAPLNAADCLYVGLADYALEDGALPGLMAALCACDWQDGAAANGAQLDALLQGMADQAKESLPPAQVEPHFARIEALTAYPTLAAVHEAVLGAQGDASPWLADAAGKLAAGCPTTAALVWETLRRARELSLADVLRMELVLALRCCANGNFSEGVRALLVDKDNAPVWQPPTLDRVDPGWIASHFEAPWPRSPLAALGERTKETA